MFGIGFGFWFDQFLKYLYSFNFLSPKALSVVLEVLSGTGLSGSEKEERDSNIYYANPVKLYYQTKMWKNLAFHTSSIPKLCFCILKVKGHPSLIILINLVDRESLMLYTKI